MLGKCDHATSFVRLPWPSTDNSVPPTDTAHGSLAGKLTERSPKTSSANAAQSPLATKTVICSTFEGFGGRSEEHTSELQSQSKLVCRLLLEKKKKTRTRVSRCRH